MLQAARTLLHPSDRAEVYQRIEDLIVETTPIVPLAHLSIDQVYQSNVQGVQLNALAGHKALNRVWLSEEKK